MSTVITHPSVPVVVLGLGVMGGDIATNLATSGTKVVGIEKGPYWNYQVDFQSTKYDEWGIILGRKFDHPLSISTFTFRNNFNQFALPIRRYTTGQGHAAGHGVGGAAQHYGGQMGRYSPWVYQVESMTVSRYGQAFLDAAVPNGDLQDWPMTYAEYTPYYQYWEKVYGVTGTNQEPFHPNSQFILPPHPPTVIGTMYQTATEALGYTPFPVPTSLASQPYMNTYGVQVNECVYDGWCGGACNYVCETGAKGNSMSRTIPAAVASGNLDMRVNSYVFRLDTNAQGLVTAARYYDSEGNIHVQPGTVFVNTLWGFNIVRMLLLSGIGNPYNPTTVTGSVGRSPAPPTGSPSRAVSGTFPLGSNSYPAGNGTGGSFAVLDWADDNFDHTNVPVPFIGGAYDAVGGYPGGGPGHMNLAAAASPANIGSTYKASLLNKWLPTATTVSLSGGGPCPPQNTNSLDLDPAYSDIYGDPLVRLTLDYPSNATNASNYIAPLLQPILTKMGASNITVSAAAVAGSAHVNSWTAHTRGGARLGTNPSTSAFNMWQQAWTAPNLFAAGEILNPMGDNTTTGGTHPVGATSTVAADGIKMYLTNPGLLT